MSQHLNVPAVGEQGGLAFGEFYGFFVLGKSPVDISEEVADRNVMTSQLSEEEGVQERSGGE